MPSNSTPLQLAIAPTPKEAANLGVMSHPNGVWENKKAFGFFSRISFVRAKA